MAAVINATGLSYENVTKLLTNFDTDTLFAEDQVRTADNHRQEALAKLDELHEPVAATFSALGRREVRHLLADIDRETKWRPPAGPHKSFCYSNKRVSHVYVCLVYES